MFKKVCYEIRESFLLVLDACFYKCSVQMDVTGSGSKYNCLIKFYALVIQVEVPGYSEERSIKLSSLNCCIIQTITFHPLTSNYLFLYDLKIDTLVKWEEKESVTSLSAFHPVVCRATCITVGNSCFSSCIRASWESELITEVIFDHLNQLPSIFTPDGCFSICLFFGSSLPIVDFKHDHMYR